MERSDQLDLERTYETILAAARDRRFVSYGDVAEASGVSWKTARRLIPRHLDQLTTIAHERGWPLLSAIVVTKEHLDTGRLEGAALEGFLSVTRALGIRVEDPEAFVRDQQQKVFEWASSAPGSLHEIHQTASGPGRGPRFVQYVSPLLDALRALGGKVAPNEVFSWIKENRKVSAEDVASIHKSGQSRFENDVAWARFYLVKAGLVDGSQRGVWALTPEGKEAALSPEEAVVLFRDIHASFKAPDNEEETAPDTAAVHSLFDDPKRQFWFAGAVWGGTNDQCDRFLAEGIWQNGYEEKFADHVKRMRSGDRIALKASFVQKYKLPFDNRGKPVSCMRIKAIGTITENMNDGKTVKVDWERLDPPRNWFFYTYRVTLVEADPKEELSRRLILFTFAGAKQDYGFWINDVPYFARRYGATARPAVAEETLDVEEEEGEEEASVGTYASNDILNEGSFLPLDAIDKILRRIRTKKNLILQGPPGTGKTWLAKRLAYALLGSRDRRVTRGRLRIVQFHPSLSYEDFVRGWRPTAGGALELMDGIFLETVQAATAEPDRPFVLIIEEVNRGNPAQIFGEMLTLLEDSKRSTDEAIELAYRRTDGERVFIPKNLHVIGTMNIADRSLALVDLALRRRFAFIDLEPMLNGSWKQWCMERCGLAEDIVDSIRDRVLKLNQDITEDRSLGAQYQVGHSYVTPLEGVDISDGWQWYREIVESEIGPLLEEYWFDAADKVSSAKRALLEDL